MFVLNLISMIATRVILIKELITQDPRIGFILLVNSTMAAAGVKRVIIALIWKHLPGSDRQLSEYHSNSDAFDLFCKVHWNDQFHEPSKNATQILNESGENRTPIHSELLVCVHQNYTTFYIFHHLLTQGVPSEYSISEAQLIVPILFFGYQTFSIILSPTCFFSVRSPDQLWAYSFESPVWH